MKILITGIGGFIGSYLLWHLLKNKENYIVGISKDYHEFYDRNTISGRFAKNFCPHEYYMFGSLRENFIKDNKFDKIYHLAACTDNKVPISVMCRGTLLSTIKIVENLEDEEFVFTSTAKVYGDYIDRPFNEEDCPNPKCSYSISKLAAELFIKNNVRNYKIFRLGPVVGRNLRYGLPKDILFQRNQDSINLRGNYPGTYRTYTHINDALSALTMNLPNGVYNVSTKNCLSNAEVCKILTGKEPNFDNQIIKNDIQRLDIDSSKIISYGWNPEFNTSEEALRNIL